MKFLVILFCAFGMGLQAKAMTAAEFTTAFVQQTNENIKIANEQRAEQNKKLYCAQLDKRQIALIKQVASLPGMTVEKFVAKVSDQLGCYAPFWKDWGHKENLAGVVFNSKAYVLDTLLIRDSIDAFAGREPNEYEAILELLD